MAARAGMRDIIQQVRLLAACGRADYTVGDVPYWSDDQLQAILDRTRVEVWDEPVTAVPQVNSGGTPVYLEFRSRFPWCEATTGGTAVYYVTDSTGARLGTADYTPDYAGGRITFAADQHGSARYLTARSYDPYLAAAEVWEAKAAHSADVYDFTADGASHKLSQKVAQYQDQARRLRAMSRTGGVQESQMVRSDVVGW